MRDFKRIEHRKKCRCCTATAQINQDGRMYCPSCYHLVYQTPAPAQDDHTDLTTGDLMAALEHGAITGRSAAQILDRLLKERTV